MPEVINIGQFDGLVPRLEPHLLPAAAAQTATDVLLDRGSLEPVRAPVADTRATAAVGADMHTVYLWRYRQWGLTCGVAGSATAATWAALLDTAGFAIVIDDATLQVEPDFTGDASMADVAASIQTALNAAVEDLSDVPGTHVVAWVTDHFEFRANGSCTLLAAPASRTDISGASWLNGASAAAAVVVDTELEKWLAWGGHVSVVPSQTHGDRFSRIFYAGAGLARPRMRLYDGWVEVDCDLRILPPATAPTHSGEAWSAGAAGSVRGAFTVSDVVLLFCNAYTGEVFARRSVTYSQDGDGISVAEQTIAVNHGRTMGVANISYTGVTVKLAVVVNGKDVTTGSTAYSTDALYTCKMVVPTWNCDVTQRRVSEGDPLQYGDSTYRTSATFSGLAKLVYGTVADGSEETEDAPTYVSYAYSYVTKYGEESALSPASAVGEVVISSGVDVAAIADPTQSDRGITTKRLYRSAGGAWRWLADIALATTTYADTTEDDDLGDAPEAELSPPLDSLDGLVALANGFLAGFRGREVWFSEPWMPYAWPEAYMLTMPDDIVALAAQGTDVYVLTRSAPVVASGSHPETMTQATVPLEQACVSAESVCVVGNSVVYATPDGLAMLYGADGRMVTAGHYTPEQWRALVPETMRAAAHDGKYFAAFASKLVLFRFGEGLDAVTETTDVLDALAADPVDDTLYVLTDTETTLKVWHASTGAARSITWRSGERCYAEPVAFGAVRVVAESYPAAGAGPITVTPYREGVAQTAVTITSGAARRLPAMRPARRWSFVVTGKATVREVCLATSMGAMP